MSVTRLLVSVIFSMLFLESRSVRSSSQGYRKRLLSYYVSSRCTSRPRSLTSWCICVHIVDDIIDLGPSYLHNMMPFERMNGVIKGFVRNMSRPDGSIVHGYLTQECISFCENYLRNGDDDVPVVGLPVNKHHGRLGGEGHTNG